MRAEVITEEMKKALIPFFWIDQDGAKRVSLGNSRLDFKKDYYFEKYTLRAVRLYWVNGDHRVYVMGKIEANAEYDEFAFYTEGWSYIEHFKLEGKNETTN